VWIALHHDARQAGLGQPCDPPGKCSHLPVRDDLEEDGTITLSIFVRAPLGRLSVRNGKAPAPEKNNWFRQVAEHLCRSQWARRCRPGCSGRTT
jgi:hypothetical protein